MNKCYQIKINGNARCYFYDGILCDNTFELKKEINDDLVHKIINPNLSFNRIYINFYDEWCDLSIFIDEGDCVIECGERDSVTNAFYANEEYKLGGINNKNVILFHKGNDGITFELANSNHLAKNKEDTKEKKKVEDGHNLLCVQKVSTSEIEFCIKIDKDIVELYGNKYIEESKRIMLSLDALMEQVNDCDEVERMQKLKIIEDDIGRNLIKKENHDGR